jgi:hypothetical protein
LAVNKRQRNTNEEQNNENWRIKKQPKESADHVSEMKVKEENVVADLLFSSPLDAEM